MDTQKKKVLKTEKDQLLKFNKIVEEAINEEKLIVEQLIHEREEILTTGQKISDKVASFGGSWKFIIAFSIVLALWVVFNTISPFGLRFDPYPFILMNLVLSALAALQAPIIMMSQNRQEEKDRKRSENDYLINLKAELEVRSLHQKIDLLLEEQIKVLFDIQGEQLKLLTSIEKRVGKSNGKNKEN